MNTHADQTQENKSQSVANGVSQMKSSDGLFQFKDNRPETAIQRKLQSMANNSPKAMQLKAFQEMTNLQSQPTAQLEEMENGDSKPQQKTIEKPKNNTGLPDNLKSGIENLSGYSMDDVKVHRNSAKPAQLQAHAYAQGSEIHLGAGQEKHLPHEAWHVVQQKQGRVKPTKQLKGKVNVNDDAGLEKEADVMGGKAVQMHPEKTLKYKSANSTTNQLVSFQNALTQTGVTSPGNFKEIAGAGTLAGGGASDLVVAENLVQSKDMEHALNQASDREAKIGNAANQIKKTPAYLAANGANFVAFNNGATLNGLEPFIFRVKVPYKKGKKINTIQLDYQQDNAYRGYIVKQFDSNDDHTTEISAVGVTNPTTKGHADSFNMAHANTGNQNLANALDQSDQSTKETNEARLDARTKLAGEGSRWVLVRNNSSKITDDSKIWTRHKGDVYWITFRTLWLNWLSVFASEYDIPDNVVAHELVHNSSWSVQPKIVKFNRFNANSNDIQVQ